MWAIGAHRYARDAMDERDDGREAEHEVAPPAETESPLEAMLASPPPPELLSAAGRTECLVGEIVAVGHPTLRGRVRARWQDLDGQTFERWLPTLHGLPVRVADRVLLTRASNWREHIVTGVIDGFAARPEHPRETRAALALERDEAVRVQAADGTPLIEVFQAEEGPVVRLLAPDVEIELRGALRVRAESIELEATRGQARIAASDDVIVEGEVIRLN